MAEKRTPEDRRAIAHEAMRRFAQFVEVGGALDAKQDGEIADLLLEHVWADMDCLSPQGAVVQQAIERLRRAKGGALPQRPEEEGAND